MKRPGTHCNWHNEGLFDEIYSFIQMPFQHHENKDKKRITPAIRDAIVEEVTTTLIPVMSGVQLLREHQI